MAAPHLALQLVGNFLRSELVALLRDHQLKGEVQKQIADLASDRLGIPVAQGVVQFQNLLDQVGTKGLPGLGAVPGTPSAEVAHHGEGASKR